METLSELSRLSSPQKDELIVRLWPLLAQVETLTKQAAAQQKQIEDLQGVIKTCKDTWPSLVGTPVNFRQAMGMAQARP